LARAFLRERIAAAVGIEIDPYYSEPARKLWRGYGPKLTIDDFTKAKALKPSERFNLIICNPPYVMHHHMDKAEKTRLLATTTASCGVQMAGIAGLYCYFPRSIAYMAGG
jgi:adenine-specific DNA-methyltransferase